MSSRIKCCLLGCLLIVGCATSSADLSSGHHTEKISGVVTLKGSVGNAWCAISEDNGKIWRLVFKHQDPIKWCEKYQNTRLVITGKRQGEWLSLPLLEFEKISDPQ